MIRTGRAQSSRSPHHSNSFTEALRYPEVPWIQAGIWGENGELYLYVDTLLLFVLQQLYNFHLHRFLLDFFLQEYS